MARTIRSEDTNTSGPKQSRSLGLYMNMPRSLLIVTLTLSLVAAFTTRTAFVDAWIATTSTTASRRIALPSITAATALRMSAVNETISKPEIVTKSSASTSASTSTSTSTSLPDFGKTTIEVDTIKLEKKRRKKEKKEPSDYDTRVGMEEKKKLEALNDKWRRPDLLGTSLVDQTIEELEKDEDFQSTQKRIEKVGLAGISREERTQRRRALDKLNVQPFARFLTEQMNGNEEPATATVTATSITTSSMALTDAPELANEEEVTAAAAAPAKKKRVKPYVLKRKAATILQINIGLYCNQACGHCHVESSPLRTAEMMTAETAAQCLELLKNTPSIDTLDITGGAPELNDHFRYLVSMARAIRGKELTIIDRCNLTVLQEPGQEDLVGFLKEHDVHVIASLPCYSAENVDTQRGGGVFERSIAALLALNEAGYGRKREPEEELQFLSSETDTETEIPPRLQLDLVYNPLGAFLPPPQEKLQVQYQEQLAANFGVLFDQLYTITNMPIKRFADFLHRRGELAEYMDLLVRNFNPDTVEELMCLNTINVGWDGKIYDCDFNQQLGYNVGVDSIHKGGKTVFDIESLDDLRDVRIRTDNHCFGCTAGMGSS